MKLTYLIPILYGHLKIIYGRLLLHFSSLSIVDQNLDGLCKIAHIPEIGCDRNPPNQDNLECSCSHKSDTKLDTFLYLPHHVIFYSMAYIDFLKEWHASYLGC